VFFFVHCIETAATTTKQLGSLCINHFIIEYWNRKVHKGCNTCYVCVVVLWKNSLSHKWWHFNTHFCRCCQFYFVKTLFIPVFHPCFWNFYSRFSMLYACFGKYHSRFIMNHACFCKTTIKNVKTTMYLWRTTMKITYNTRVNSAKFPKNHGCILILHTRFTWIHTCSNDTARYLFQTKDHYTVQWKKIKQVQ